MDEMRKVFEQLESVYRKHPEYKKEAYHFVMVALHYTLNKLKEHRHLTGQELSHGIRDYALEQFGSLAKTVFEYWGISETFDFGKIVYYMIDEGLMSKTEEDSINDFKDVYTFEDAFHQTIDYDIS